VTHQRSFFETKWILLVPNPLQSRISKNSVSGDCALEERVDSDVTSRMSKGLDGSFQSLRVLMGTPLQESIHIGVEHRRNVKRYNLREEQSADHAKTEWTAGVGVGAKPDGDRQGAYNRAGAGHHDWAEANH